MDFYKILGVDKSETKSQIRKAYLRLAKKHHPDKGGDKEKMQEIQNAYDILSDSEKRAHYDSTGESNTGNGKTPTAKFIEYVYSQIESLLSSRYEDKNLVQKLRENTYSIITSAQDNMVSLNNKIRTIQGLKDKFYVNGDGDNIFLGVMESKIKELEKNILQQNDIVKTHQDFYAMLDNYGFGEQIKTKPRNYKQETEDYAKGLFVDLTMSNKYQKNDSISASEVANHLASCSKEFSYVVDTDKIVITHIASGETATTEKFNIA